MESSLSIENILSETNHEDDVSLTRLEKPVRLDKSKKNVETIDLDMKIRCATVECFSGQMVHVDAKLASMQRDIELNTTRLKNIWRHHSQLSKRVEAVVEETERAVDSGDLVLENGKLRFELAHVRDVMRRSLSQLDDLKMSLPRETHSGDTVDEGKVVEISKTNDESIQNE